MNPGPRSGLVGSPFDNHPSKLPQKSVDVRCPPFPCSAINFNRYGLPTSFAASSVKDHFNISVTGKTLLHRLVRQRNTTSNDELIFLDRRNSIASQIQTRVDCTASDRKSVIFDEARELSQCAPTSPEVC